MKMELEKRLIELAIEIHHICKYLDRSYLSYHLTKQIIRSSTSAALNYGEAQVAESRRDFIHKIGIVLKELKETSINLTMLQNVAKMEYQPKINNCKEKCEHLVAIFQKTKNTAKTNNK